MRVVAFLVLVLALGFGSAAADEAKPARQPTPLTVEQAKDAVLKAFRADDEKALKALAEKKTPDPWLVAEFLVLQGERKAAAAYAASAEVRPDVKALPAYVRARPQAAYDERTWRAPTEALSTAQKGKGAEALARLDALRSEAATVLATRIELARGHVLRHLRRLPDCIQAYVAAADRAKAMGWLAIESELLRTVQATLASVGAFPQIVPITTRFVALERVRQSGAVLAYALRKHAQALDLTERGADAMAALDEALAVARRYRHKREEAAAHTDRGSIHERRGNYELAVQAHEEGLRIFRAVGDKMGIAAASNNLAMACVHVEDVARAISLYEAALPVFRELRHVYGQLAVLGNLGNACESIGRLDEAQRHLEASLVLCEQLGNPRAKASVLNSLGNVMQARGAYAKALDQYSEALEARLGMGDRRGAAQTLRNLGHVHHLLGRLERAEEMLEQSAEHARAVGSSIDEAAALAELGSVKASHGDSEGGIAELERGLALLEASGKPLFQAAALNQLATAHARCKDYEKALEYERRSLAIDERRGDMPRVAMSRLMIATHTLKLGDAEQALTLAQQVLAEVEALQLRAVRVQTLQLLAEIHARSERWTEALKATRAVVHSYGDAYAGLSEQSGASAREQLQSTFDHALRAALALKDVDAAAEMLESGRGLGFLEAMHVRTSLQEALVPDKLRRAEQDARAEERRAVAAYRRASARRKLKAMRAARETVAAARARRAEIVARIQRTERAGASIAYPQADGREDLQAHLRPGEALVLYGLTGTSAVAFVATPETARMVHLASAADVAAACAGVLTSPRSRLGDKAVARLEDLLVKPLELPRTVKTVLLSPVGRLGYVPFGALFAERAVAYLPSGTALGVLRAEKPARGRAVLALGNPDYATTRARRTRTRGGGTLALLPALPATRAEVQAVGTTVLLGKDASETALAKHLADVRRWRAVHFACHGLVDPERPMLSCLALSADRDSDGYLSCLDVFRMRIPADLVVLSACETGKGKIYKSEGIVGLTRAFMFAGAPRVLCSLWKVDDEATQALMIKFYALWNPKSGKEGLGAAAALKQAQAYVQSHDKWKHPYFWAAWALWGLPE